MARVAQEELTERMLRDPVRRPLRGYRAVRDTEKVCDEGAQTMHEMSSSPDATKYLMVILAEKGCYFKDNIFVPDLTEYFMEVLTEPGNHREASGPLRHLSFAQ